MVIPASTIFGKTLGSINREELVNGLKVASIISNVDSLLLSLNILGWVCKGYSLCALSWAI